MGKKKSAKIAKPPDIQALADKTFAQNKASQLEALTANRVDQKNPFGTIDWQRDPATGEWTQTEAYNPEQQALYDLQLTNQGTMGKMAGGLLGEMDLHYDNAPSMPTVGGYNQQALDTIRALQNPDITRRTNAGNANLAAQGFSTGGGKAWESAQGTMNDMASRADMNAILESLKRGDTMFNQGMQARNAYTGEQDRMLQNAGGMMKGAAPVNLKFDDTYAQAVSAGSPDYAGNALKQQQAQQAYNNMKAAQSNSGGMLGGMGGTLGSIGGMALGSMVGMPTLGASLGGAIGGGIDSGSWEGAAQGGIGGYMGSGSGGWLSGLPGMSGLAPTGSGGPYTFAPTENWSY
jgi:hypothetical protein